MAQPDAAAQVQMVRVNRTERDVPAIVIAVGAARVEVRKGFDRELLGEVIAALGGTR
jgi:hypothetical protein